MCLPYDAPNTFISCQTFWNVCVYFIIALNAISPFEQSENERCIATFQQLRVNYETLAPSLAAREER